MTTLNPYLSFKDNCEQAFEFYKSVFGGEYNGINRFGDMPMPGAPPLSEAEAKKIMHISLPIGGDSYLMGSDSFEGMGPGLKGGNNVNISIHPDSKERAKKIFDGLAAGGNVTMPIMDAPWGAYFGMVVDKFGVSWMVNFDYEQNKN